MTCHDAMIKYNLHTCKQLPIKHLDMQVKGFINNHLYFIVIAKNNLISRCEVKHVTLSHSSMRVYHGYKLTVSFLTLLSSFLALYSELLFELLKIRL